MAHRPLTGAFSLLFESLLLFCCVQVAQRSKWIFLASSTLRPATSCQIFSCTCW